MPDISMCLNKPCPRFKECYRAQAKPGHWQSYMSFKYTIASNGAICENFIPLRNKESNVAIVRELSKMSKKDILKMLKTK